MVYNQIHVFQYYNSNAFLSSTVYLGPPDILVSGCNSPKILQKSPSGPTLISLHRGCDYKENPLSE